uniref:Zinc finger and BTB domain containing 38 n=1 Tax=Oreochromis niloticus TaxID=8128 RepID=A0A669DIG6_ORENI
EPFLKVITHTLPIAALSDDSQPEISKCINSYRLQGLFCDVTIVVEDVKFRAHKNILAACSGYFRNALTTSEPWNSSQVLELMDLKSEVFACILNFMYCSKVTSSDAEDTRGVVASPDLGQLPSSCSTTSCFSGNNETTHALSEHSYAVCKSTEGKDSSQCDSKKVCKPAVPQPKQLIYRNIGPLKKRHKLRSILGKSMLPTPAEPETDKPNTVTPTFTDGATATPATVMTPPPLFSEAEKSIDTGPPMATDNAPMELGPPTLSPQTEDSISIYGCEHCPEIFTNKALLTIHSEVHKKRFVSHLFCTFCHRKFIHLKRLRNHEQVCPKALRGPPKLDSRDSSTKEVDHHSDDGSEMETNTSQPPPTDLPSPYTPEPLQVDQSEPPHDEKPMKIYGGQRRYNCSVCKRVYVTLSSLKRHENVHSWQRAYPCHYCNKVFALAEYRTKHEIWHTGERRYQCIFCLETFMTYYILKNHQKSFHGIDPTLSVKKKSANGGLKSNIYPLKLYRLLPMKFRKRQYKTYSHTYSERAEGGDQPATDSNSVIPQIEENGLNSHPDTASFPLTFMATTKMISPVIFCS